MKYSSPIVRRSVAVLGLVFLVGCVPLPATPTGAGATPTTQPLAATATATRSAPATHTPLPTSAPTSSTPTTTPVPSVTPSAEQTLRLDSIHMMTATEGWATGSMADATGNQPQPGLEQIYRTTDGGVHWQDVSPTGISPASVAATYFLDAAQAWAAVSSSGSETGGSIPTTVTIYRTTDGGQTWEHGEPISISAGGGPGQLDFVDPQHGWLMASLGAGMMHEAVAIYSTTDGGMQWQQVSLTSGMEGESTPGSLPFVCDKSGITFSDTSTGWAAGACPGGALFFFVSHDGGQTWQPQTMPAPPGYSADLYSQCQCAVSRPTFVTPQVGFVTIQIYEQQQSAVLYVTEDGGATWTSRELPAAQLVGGSPDFVDASTGWLTDGQQLYVTHDAGQTWSPVGTLPLPGGDLRSLDFVDADNGWLLGQQPYVTHDAGQSWSIVSPVATAGPGTSTTPTVTLADDGTTLPLQPGERFLLKLGEDYDWTVIVADQSIVSRVVNILVVRGAQGVYEAHQVGSTTLTATGDPVCRQAQPPCAAPSREFRLEIVVSAATPTPTGQASFTDPFAYCAAVGTIDAPDARYAGPKVPESIARGLQAALNAPDMPQQPDSDFIPAYITGHDTIYEWRCTNGAPEIVKQVFQVDAQGFIADIWYPINPQ